MLKRIITAVVLILILLPILIFSWRLSFLIPALVALMATVATFELLRCLGQQRDLFVSIPAYLIACGLPLGTIWAHRVSTYLAVCVAVLSVYLLYLYTVAVFRRGRMPFADLATAFVGVAYIAVSFASLALLRHQTANGGYLYLLVFFGAWVTDTFAYFTGRFFGRHKLNPEISPKKTVEGSIGGIVFCVASFIVFGVVMQKAWDMKVNYVLLILAGVICSFVSQIGDLITSLIKREHDVKDFGRIFPGHGGVLDRFDSVLAISPILLILCNLTRLGGAWAILS
jgi:phosphatidate cytidylyltransferase